MTEKPFFSCTNCRFVWKTREDFIVDKTIAAIGYQVNFVNLKAGFFLFNHICGTTFTIDVHVFADLYDGPVYEEKLTGGHECPGYCLHTSVLEPCPAKCECAYVREILQILKK